MAVPVGVQGDLHEVGIIEGIRGAVEGFVCILPPR